MILLLWLEMLGEQEHRLGLDIRQTMNYKDGRTLKPYYCKCGNNIELNNALYGTGLCVNCGKLGRKLSDETKNKIRQSLKGRKRPKISEQMIGQNNHQFRNRTNFCNNCHKELDNRNAKHCRNCYIGLGLNKGEKAPNYINGASKRKYAFGFTHKIKKQIRKRDNYECQNCYMTEDIHLMKYGSVLEIHHIDYNKNNHDEKNLITSCKQCNVKANYNRAYWTEYFKNKISLKLTEKPNGQCNSYK